MKLTAQEAKVVEILRANPKCSIEKIKKILGIGEVNAKRIVHTLMNKEAIERVKYGLYKVLIDSYEVIEEEPVKHHYEAINLDTSKIPKEIKEYIIKYEPYKPRSWIAKKLKLPKILVNQVLIEETGVKRSYEHA